MTDFDQLNAAAFHAEKVASRRLAMQESLSAEQALRQIMELAAGSAGLQQLLSQRKAQAQANLARLAARRQGKRDERALKLNQNRVPAGSWQAWFDGSARPNPGRCGIGGLLAGPNGERFEICQDAGYGNSSEAEYLALIALLEVAVKVQATPLLIHGDSQVVIDDVTGSASAAAPSLGTNRARALVLIGQISEVSLRWIPRHRNGQADALSQRASSSPMHRPDADCAD